MASRPQREEIILQAAEKPIRKMVQFDVFTGAVEDDLIVPDEDGDWISFGSSYDLVRSECIRLRFIAGTPLADVSRALRKIASEIDELGNNSSMLPGMLEPEPATDEDYHATVEHAPYVLKRARKLAKQQRKRYRDFQP